MHDPRRSSIHVNPPLEPAGHRTEIVNPPLVGGGRSGAGADTHHLSTAEVSGLLVNPPLEPAGGHEAIVNPPLDHDGAGHDDHHHDDPEVQPKQKLPAKTKKKGKKRSAHKRKKS